MSLTPTSPFLKSVLSTGPSSDSQDVRLIVRSLEKLTLGTGTLTQTFASVASDEYRPLIDITIAVTGGQFLSDATLNLDSLNHRVGDLITIDYTSSDIPAGRSIFIKDLKNATTLATLTANSSGILTLSLDATNTWVVDDTIDTGTFAIKAPNGSAAAPSYSFSTDTGTGFYKFTTGQVGFASSGVSTLLFENTGIIQGLNSGGTGQGYIKLGASGDVSLVAGGTTQNITISPSGNSGVTNFTSGVDATTGISIRGTGTSNGYITGGASALLSLDQDIIAFRNFAHTDQVRITNGHLLVGGLTVDGTGVIQLQTATTAAGGINFGDVTVYRNSGQTIIWTGAGGNALLIDTANTRIATNFFNAITGGTISFQANASPQVDGAVDLGAAATRWNHLYVKNGVDSGASNLNLLTNATACVTLSAADQTVNFAKTISSYNGLATAGNGVVTVQGAGNSVAQTGAVASIATYTVGASDADFIVSGNVLVTTATAHSFSLQCTYTDESNAARTVTFNVQQIAGTLVTAITNVTGAGPYEGVPLHIRAKAGTAITILTSGTFTTVTYNARAVIRKLQ